MCVRCRLTLFFFFLQAEDGIRDYKVTGVQTCALPICARKVFESAGATLKDFYMVMGQYDMVIIAEAPNDTAIAKALLSVARKGAVQTETLRAFTESEYRSIASGL